MLETNLVLINASALFFIVLLDLLCRMAAEIRIELVTIEVIIFSCVHSIYQWISISLLGHNSIWQYQHAPSIKMLIMFVLLILSITLYRRMQRHLDAAVSRFTNSLIYETKNAELINNIASKYIRADLWNSTSSKRSERENMKKLFIYLGVPSEDVDPDKFMINQSTRVRFIVGTSLLWILIAVVAFIPM